ncbi:MAG TPA: hypothetical protein VLX92_11440 [Kofleriaceae bacterium]|nr:hypothetical protein [Kofleriaceae bacterium]
MRAVLVAIVVCACSRGGDGALDEFHAGERRCLAAFNDALHRQGRNEIDELELADAIDHDVLPAWRTMRVHVEAAALPPDLAGPMHAYLADRQAAWEAYVAALHAPNDAAAAPSYALYHRKDAEADADARRLAAVLPR